ncbi:MAG: histidine kinase N-terminal 7TM domain-containing protein [Myxococcota bacterium]
MHPAVVQTAVTIFLAVVTAGYVLARSERRAIHWLICGLMAAVAVWTASMGVRHVPGAERFERVALIGWFVGLTVMPPLWLAVAVRLTRTRPLLPAPAAFAGLGLPALAGLLLLLTNDSHGLMIRDGSFDAMKHGASRHAGPLFWVQLAWCYGITLGGVVLYFRQGLRMVDRGEPWRGLAVTVGAALPLIASVLRAAGWIPTSFSLTPAAACTSVVVMMTVYWRYGLADIVPVARQDVIENLSDAVVVTDPRGRLVDANPAAERLFGATVERLRTRPLLDALGEFAVGLDLEEVERNRSVVQGDASAFTRVRMRDGRELEVTSAAVRNRDDQVAGYYAVLRDRSEQRKLERFLHQSQRLETVAALAAGVAHEVNNPLAYVRANLNHLRSLADEARTAEVRKPEEFDELRLVVEECVDGVDRIARIIAGMLRFSRLESGGPETVDVAEVIEDAVRLAQLHETASVEVEASCEARLPAVSGSAENLVQAVLNLLVNGKQALAGRDDAHIRLAARAQDADVVIEVSDNGPGIPEELRERIFSPFFTTKGRGEGSGLGLAISAEIARKHGGRLELAMGSQSGATFRLCLPARVAPV